MANTIDGESKTDRAQRWATYREYLEGADGKISADQELKPGSKAWLKLRELSDRLAEVQEKDFQAKQLKLEIDRALHNAGALGALIKAFDFSSRSDSFEDS